METKSGLIFGASEAAAADSVEGDVDAEVDASILLVDETSSDDSDEIAVFDSRDLNNLSDERKAICEERIFLLYKTFRLNGPEYRTRRTIYGFTTLDTDFIDYVQKGTTVEFDEEQISKAVLAFHVEEVGIRDGAASLGMSVFDFIVLLMDHIWKERDKTIENYSISRVAGYLGVDRAHIRLLGNLVNSNIALNPSEIAAKTLSEPLELIVMLTMLMAQMYGWPVAEDFNQKWKAIETASVPSDEEAVQSISDFVTIAEEVLDDFKNDQSSPLCRHTIDGTGENLVLMSTELADYASNLVNELTAMKTLQRNLPLPDETIPRADILPPSWERQAEMLANEKNGNIPKKPVADTQTSDQNRSGATGEEISVVDVERSELSQKNFVIIEDPPDISNIPLGSFCLARQQKALNFVRCQIVGKVSQREYSVLFGDGTEEVIDISRIARKIEGRLRMWEGVRVCALYEPKLRNERYRKAFYSGIVGVGSHGFSQNEMLVFFDIGIDSLVPERTVYMLAEQIYRLHNYKEIIDRRSNWNLVPQFRQKFVKHYLNNFPDWPLVPMKRRENTQRVNILRGGRPHSAYVLQTERQFALLRFPNRGRPGADCVATPCNRHSHLDEWVYRGSERLDAIRQTIDRMEKSERQGKMGISAPPMRSRREARLAHNLEYAVPLPRRNISNIELVDLSADSDLCARGKALLADIEPYYPRRQTARKGGNLAVQHENAYQDYIGIEGRTLRPRKEKNITVQNAPDWTDHLRQEVHSPCTIDCLQRLDKDPYDKEFYGYSPYMIPLLVGWSREMVTFTRRIKIAHGRKAAVSAVVYRTPCGVHIYKMDQIAKYLKDTCSRLTIDLFTFDRTVRPNVIYQTPVKARLMDDFTNGYEAVPIAVYNEIDSEMPPKIDYDPRRYPYNQETDISSISVDFCSGCTCTDDCSDETRCECRLLTRAEVLRLDKSLQPSYAKGYMFWTDRNVPIFFIKPMVSEYLDLSVLNFIIIRRKLVIKYVSLPNLYRNLALGGTDESYLSGLYECNEKCGCSRSSCHNRVVQQQMKIPLELFKTEKMGWGVRSMVDIPAGVFICTYAGAILTDSQAEMEGKMCGDEYFADVNLVDIVEKEKRNAGVDLGDPNDGYYSDEDNQGGQRNGSSDNELVVGGDDTYRDDQGYDSGQDSSFSSEGSHADGETIKTRKHRRHMRAAAGDVSSTGDEESRDAVAEGLKKNQSAATDLDYARSSLVMTEPDVFTEDVKNETDNVSEIVSTGPPKGRFDMVKYVESMQFPSLYIIDAKRRGNIGRFFNHSCEPNVRTQLAYVDTHDFRLPWIAFFTTTKISAGSELFWDYGYAEGAVVGKQLECFCGSRFCRKRLL